MTRYLVIGGALSAMIGASGYYGFGGAWGAPVAFTGLASLSVGFGLLFAQSEGASRWFALAIAVTGSSLVVVVVSQRLVAESSTSESTLISGLFISFMASLALFGLSALVNGSAPGLVAATLIVGTPLLAVGVWQERMGDIGFPITVLGLVLLGLTIELSSG